MFGIKKKIQARGEKIQANDGHVVSIKELCGSLYLFEWSFKKKIQARGGQWGENKWGKKIVERKEEKILTI